MLYSRIHLEHLDLAKYDLTSSMLLSSTAKNNDSSKVLEYKKILNKNNIINTLFIYTPPMLAAYNWII